MIRVCLLIIPVLVLASCSMEAHSNSPDSWKPELVPSAKPESLEDCLRKKTLQAVWESSCLSSDAQH